MKLYEYQGKEIFRKAGISVPKSQLIRNESDLESLLSSQQLPIVAKAQVLAGGRGKAGLIKVLKDQNSVREIAQEWLGKKYNSGTIGSVLFEEVLDIHRELYLSVSIDSAMGSPVIIASGEGGVDIEELSIAKPEAITKEHINILRGIQPYQIRYIVSGMEVEGAAAKATAKAVSSLYNILRSYDAELVEINPLVIDRNGNPLAADAKITIDDSALFRQKAFSKGPEQFDDELEYEAYQKGLTYVKLDGNIGVICTGAGLNMTALDLIKLNGGRPANFVDFGGVNYKNSANALRMALKTPDIKVLLLMTFGLMSRADTIAEGLVRAIKELQPEIPIVMALRGTGEEKARELIKEIGIESHSDTEEAVRRAISIAE